LQLGGGEERGLRRGGVFFILIGHCMRGG
jgi:hypothetical protein